MAISVFASFRTYALFSIVLTTGIVSHAFFTKRFFYRSVVHLAHSKLAIMSMFNMALMLVIFAWRVVQFIFLGPLRFRERERLHLRARDAIIESCFAMSIFRSEFNLVFVSIVITLLLVKSLHWLAKDRIEFLEEQPLSPRRAHIRLVSLLIFLLCVDSVLIARSVMTTFESNKSMFALFVFEFSILIVELLSDFVRYVFLVIDLSMDGRWDGKNLYSFYNELMSDLCQLTLYILFFVYVQIKYNQFPYHIIRELYMTFIKFQRRFSDFLRYRRVVATMNDLFADATDEQLAEGDRTCIICREEMTSAKVLSCSHMFHARCLQSWLKRQLSCPTCRANIDVNLPTHRAQGLQQGNVNENPIANVNAGAGANPNANVNANANDNVNANDNANANANEDVNLNANADANANGNENGNGNGNANGNVDPERNANENVNANGRLPGVQQGAAAGLGGAVDALGPNRLMNNVNNWWEMLMQPAVGGNPGAAYNQAAGDRRAAPPIMPNARPRQNVGGNVYPNTFGIGPNAMAHQQLRARRRIAWGYPIHPPYGAVPHWPPMVFGNQQINQQIAAGHFGANRNNGNGGNGATARNDSPAASNLGGNFSSGVTSARSDVNVSGTEDTGASSSQAAGTLFNQNHRSFSGSSSTEVPPTFQREDEAGEVETSSDTRVPICTTFQANSQGLGGIDGPSSGMSHTNDRIVLPLERLLNIQEQIEVLRAEVESLVLVATGGDDEASEIMNKVSSRGTGEISINEAEGVVSENDDSMNPSSGQRESEVQDREDGDDGGEDEAARIRRHRIEFLERRRGV